MTPLQEPNKSQSTNDQFLRILKRIMDFCTKFNLPETGTEALIKFTKLLLEEISGPEFDSFPNSLYLARKALGLTDKFQSFVACPKCHKLYDKNEVKEFCQNDRLSVMKCRHVEFPNSTSRKTKLCNTDLSKQIKLLGGKIENKAVLIYPFVRIQDQLKAMYCRPEFENLLRHWANRQQFDNILSDVYDGQVWRNFKDTNEEGSPNFFRADVADSHLGLMLNLNWFQSFDGTIHSTRVIYMAICNLLRDIRFKPENMLILSLLPEPNEVSLHKINHYLIPIVDKLELL